MPPLVTISLEALRALIILGFLRHGQEGLNKTRGAAIVVCNSPLGHFIQCLLHPAIPWQVAPQQSLTPFHRATGIRSVLQKPMIIAYSYDYAVAWKLTVRTIERTKTRQCTLDSVGQLRPKVLLPFD